MINKTDRVPVNTIAPKATSPSRTAGIRALRSHKLATTTGAPTPTTSARIGGICANPPVLEGLNGNDDTGKPRCSKRRHSTRTAAKNEASTTVTTIPMAAMRYLRPTGWLACRASSQKMPAYAAVCQAAGQLRLG